MTAWRKFKSLFLLLVLLVLCAGLLTAAKGKTVLLATGEMGEPSEAPFANASVCVEEGRVPGRWRLPGVLHHGRWGKAMPESRASIALFPPLSPPPLLPFTWLARHALFFGGVGCWGERSQTRVGLKLRCGGRCCLLGEVAQRVAVAGVVPRTLPGARAAGKVARAKLASQVLAQQGLGGTNRRACLLPRLPAPLHPLGGPFFPLQRTQGVSTSVRSPPPPSPWTSLLAS